MHNDYTWGQVVRQATTASGNWIRIVPGSEMSARWAGGGANQWWPWYAWSGRACRSFVTQALYCRSSSLLYSHIYRQAIPAYMYRNSILLDSYVPHPVVGI